MIVAPRRGALPPGRRVVAAVAVGAARLLATQPPRRIRGALSIARRGARSADFEQAIAAREAAEIASVICRGPASCLPRSIATALICRASGTWPTWCVGVRRTAPFVAHAWVEVDGATVGEPEPAERLCVLIAVPPDATDAPDAPAGADGPRP